ncbi:MAG TPA: hypothetical protein VF363_12020 [Candidatus Eisenbacteria bacterium]
MRHGSFIFASALALSAAVAATPGPAAATAAGWSEASARAVVLPAGVRALAAPAAPDPAATVTALERAGYRVHVALLPGTYFVSATSRASALPAGLVDAVESWSASQTPAAPADAPASSAGETAAAEPGPADPFGGRADALPPLDAGAAARGAGPRSAPPLPSGLPYGARWDDTSEFMIGRVAVPILFPESDGTTDPNHYDWTPALRDSVIRGSVRGLLKWSLRAAARGVSLTFLIEVRTDLATRYEPIDRPIGSEELWIEDALETLVGYRADAATMAYDYANAARGRLGAQWAAIIFPVQNDTSAVGTFPDGYISHARLGGPWFVTPVNNLNTTSASYDYYVEHEMTHMFWALDEYPANNAWWSCTLTTGYFNRPNTNSSIPAPGYCHVPVRQCLMTGNYPDSFCVFTEDQIGWADRDKDGVLDLYQTRPLVAPDSTKYRTGAGVPVVLRGSANESAIPNQNPYRYLTGDSISIATIVSIEYRVDGGSWIATPCDDGTCDFGTERFTVVLPPPTVGTHTVDWRAWNSNGLTALLPASTTITIGGASSGFDGSGGGADAAPRLTAGPTPSRGTVRVSLRAAPSARARARVVDVGGRTVRSWSFTLPGSGILAWDWDLRRQAGGPAPSGLYFVKVDVGSVTLTQRVMVFR